MSHLGKTCQVLLCCMCATVLASAQQDISMQAMKDELSRSVKELQLQAMEKPYFVAYRMDDFNVATISASLGSLTTTQPVHMRLINVEVRVGDYALDNSNYFSARSFGSFAAMMSAIGSAPLDDNYQQIRRQFWLATDAQYKKALEDLSAKRAALQMRKRTDETPDFAKALPATESDSPNFVPFTTAELESLAREISAVFRNLPEIPKSSVEVELRNDYIRYVNSEGSEFTRAKPIFKLVINAQAQAPSGLPVGDSLVFLGRSLSDLPAKQDLLKRTRDLASRVLRTRSAQSLESYNGPVLFEDEAAAEIFSQQFAGGFAAVRTPLTEDQRFEVFFNQMMGQLGGGSFVDKIGGRVLPEFLSVTDNPLQGDFQGHPLLGNYKIDDDAVKARKTVLVERGVLKNLLATRTPVRTAPQSTGNRRGWGAVPSNLFVTSEKGLAPAELRKELLRRAKERGLDYGIIVRRVGGGSAASFMRIAMRMAQRGTDGDSLAEVYKIYPDGREELLQGVEIKEMAASNFKEIVATGSSPAVFNDEFVPKISAMFSMGISGSTDLPIVSLVVPSLLFEEVSLSKSEGPFPNLPISPSPLAAH